MPRWYYAVIVAPVELGMLNIILCLCVLSPYLCTSSSSPSLSFNAVLPNGSHHEFYFHPGDTALAVSLVKYAPAYPCLVFWPIPVIIGKTPALIYIFALPLSWFVCFHIHAKKTSLQKLSITLLGISATISDSFRSSIWHLTGGVSSGLA